VTEGSRANGGLIPIDVVETGEGVFFGRGGEDAEGSGSLDGEAAFVLGVGGFAVADWGGWKERR
jgi:hypothetical protein